MINGFYVYKYISREGNVVYIGKSEKILQRIKQHSSFSGLDSKFEKYKDAEIYVHKCNSQHEMDALELMLIEKYKPELNSTGKTKEELSFEFEIKWISLSEFLKAEGESSALTHGLEKTKGKSGENLIKSRKEAREFINKVEDWHVLFYFMSWLTEQSDDDTRATVEFSLSDMEEVSKWIWEADVTKEKSNEITFVSKPFLWDKNMFVNLVDSEYRDRDRIWVDFCRPVNILKKAIPLMQINLKKCVEEIKSYKGISENYIDKSKENGFYDYFTHICFETIFPDVQPEKEEREFNELVHELILDTIPVKHTSPVHDFFRTASDNHGSTVSMRKESKCWPGGAYWNAWGADSLSGEAVD